MTHQAKAPSAMKHPIAIGGLALALLCGLFAVFAAGSQAAVEPTPSYTPGAFFGAQGAGPGQFSEPHQIAAEKGTGNLLVTDSGNGRVQVFATDADANPSFLTTLGASVLKTPVGIAVDPGNGSIYVSDSGAGEIFRFTSDGAPTPTYTLDATFTSPTELVSFASTLAVDPSTHDLLVADTGSQEVRRFDVADGHLIKSFNGSTSPGGQFSSIRGIAVASSGRIYVLDEYFPGAFYFELGDATRVEQFDPDGEPLGQLQGANQEAALGMAGETALLAWHGLYGNRQRLSTFEGSDTPAATAEFPPGIEGGPVSIAAPGAAFVLIESVQGVFGVPGIQPFTPAEVPGAELGPITGVGSSTAHVTGAVAPGTLSGPGSARFEYSFDGGTTWAQGPEQTGITGPGETIVADDPTDLRPNSSYSVRLRVANDDFSTVTSPASFTTDPVAPGVALGALTDRSASGVVLNGTVNPFGQQSTYHFEYGETDAYGQRVPVGHEDVAGGGFGERNVTEGIAGLKPSTTYHYRLVATNAMGTNSTPDATFTTRSAAEPVRAYEQVSPVDKGGAVISTYGYHQANDAGDAIVYQAKNAMGNPNVESAPVQPRYGALRSPTGWTSRPLDPPQDATYTAAVASAFTIAASPDKSHALVSSNRALTSGAVAGSGNVYRRDLATGTYELVASGFTYSGLIGLSGMEAFYGGNEDFSTIYLLSAEQLSLDGTLDGTPGVLTVYEWTAADGLRAASPSDGYATVPFRLNWPEHRVVGDDGSGYISTQGGAQPGIYRAFEGETELLTAPSGGATLLDVSSDGRYLSYTSEGAAYRYDTITHSSELIFGAAVGSGVGMSENGATFLENGPGGNELDVWHQGVVTHAAHSEGAEGVRGRGVLMSPNGRYVAFSNATLTGQAYDNSGCPFAQVDDSVANGKCLEVYVYDAEEKTLTCASCPADGSRSIGHAHLDTIIMELGLSGGRRILDDGAVLFDTPAKLVAADQNGTRDVYLYRDGEAELISPGNGPFTAAVADGSADFHDVFFVTDQPLVGQDTDNQFDLYDARIGGGIPSQGPGSPSSFCAGSDCRAPVAAPSATPPAIGSESVVGETRKQCPKCRKHKAKRKHKKAAMHRDSKHRAGGHQRSAAPGTANSTIDLGR